MPMEYLPAVTKKEPMEQGTQQWKMVGIFLVGFVIGVGATWLWFERGTGMRLTSSTGSSTEQLANVSDISALESSGPSLMGTPTNGNVSIEVSDQPAGMSVLVRKVAVIALTWVVIREDAAGSPGKALGAQLFDAGTWSGKVLLLRGTAPGGTYYAELAADNGDRAFDLHADQALLGADGKPVMTVFKAK